MTRIPIRTWSLAAPPFSRPAPVSARASTIVDPLFETSHGPPLGASTIEVAPTLKAPGIRTWTHPISSLPPPPPVFVTVTTIVTVSPASKPAGVRVTCQLWAAATGPAIASAMPATAMR